MADQKLNSRGQLLGASGPKILAHHLDGECLFQVGDWPEEGAQTSDAMFCCAVAETGSPYCPDHNDDAHGRKRRSA